jgi:hypothetical protein
VCYGEFVVLENGKNIVKPYREFMVLENRIFTKGKYYVLQNG